MRLRRNRRDPEEPVRVERPELTETQAETIDHALRIVAKAARTGEGIEPEECGVLLDAIAIRDEQGQGVREPTEPFDLAEEIRRFLDGDEQDPPEGWGDRGYP